MSELLEELNANRDLGKDYQFSERLAAELHTYYIKNTHIIEKEIMEIIGKSVLDKDKTLMPMQLNVLKQISRSEKIVISAPTSFGKTFIVLEYIMRNNEKFKKIFYVVHTKSLKDEIILKVKKSFSKIYSVFEDISEIEDEEKFICVLISDGQNIYQFDKNIDLLVVDEAYNLSKLHSGERYFCIINSYRLLMNLSQKIILLGPFISYLNGEVAKSFSLIKTDYSPVVNKLYEGIDLENKLPNTMFLDKIKSGENTIGYFGSKQKIYHYMNEIKESGLKDIYEDSFIIWMEKSFPDFWLLPKIMRKGIGLYHSSFPKYINIYNMEKFNAGKFKGMITTSAILEGVNTASKNLVIFETSVGQRQQLTPFQFFNLCGRVGRLGKEIVGNVYNFGELYKERYSEKSLPLFIGMENVEELEDKIDEGYDDDEVIERINKMIEMLKIIGIEYDEWYQKNKYYFNGSKNLFNILNVYFDYRRELKAAYESKELLSSKNVIGKEKILDHVYEKFIKNVNGEFIYKPSSRFYVNSVLKVLLRSMYKGIDFNMKSVCNSYEIEYDLNGRNIAEKNQYIVEVMNVGYNYIPHSFSNISYVLNDFISHDAFFDEEFSKEFEKSYFDRILLYVKGDTSKYSKVNKLLNTMGFVPTLIEKIMTELKKTKIEVDNLKRSEMIELIKKVLEKLKLEDFEKINLGNLGF